jgi:hypothetical protein
MTFRRRRLKVPSCRLPARPRQGVSSATRSSSGRIRSRADAALNLRLPRRSSSPVPGPSAVRAAAEPLAATADLCSSLAPVPIDPQWLSRPTPPDGHHRSLVHCLCHPHRHPPTADPGRAEGLWPDHRRRRRPCRCGRRRSASRRQADPCLLCDARFDVGRERGRL